MDFKVKTNPIHTGGLRKFDRETESSARVLSGVGDEEIVPDEVRRKPEIDLNDILMSEDFDDVQGLKDIFGEGAVAYDPIRDGTVSPEITTPPSSESPAPETPTMTPTTTSSRNTPTTTNSVAASLSRPVSGIPETENIMDHVRYVPKNHTATEFSHEVNYHIQTASNDSKPNLSTDDEVNYHVQAASNNNKPDLSTEGNATGVDEVTLNTEPHSTTQGSAIIETTAALFPTKAESASSNSERQNGKISRNINDSELRDNVTDTVTAA